VSSRLFCLFISSISNFGKSIRVTHSLSRYAGSLCGEAWETDELWQETYKRALPAKRKLMVADSDDIRPWDFTIMRQPSTVSPDLPNYPEGGPKRLSNSKTTA
jgi:hypothetical protein